jgi:pSer/pThr/pTyr-binding forkhead associated (FHA) protein
MAISPINNLLKKIGLNPIQLVQQLKHSKKAPQVHLQQLDQDDFVSRTISTGTLIGRQYQDNLGITVSRCHASLDKNGIIKDLDSRRGTFVNGKLIKEPVQLKPSDTVRLGHENTYYQFDGNRLISKTTTIGRNPTHDFRPSLDDSISRDHARISPVGVITDLNSRNGTFVDGHKLNGPYQLENGNIIAFCSNNRTYYYYSHGKIHPLTPQKAQLLQQLFPRGLSQSNFKQGFIGNCTFLSTLKSLLKNNPAKLIEMIEPLPNGKVKFSFMGSEKPPFELALDDYKSQGVQGPLGIQLLETAFGRYLKPAREYNTVVVLDEGGYAHKAIKALTSGKRARMIYDSGRPLAQNPEIKKQAIDCLNQIEKDPVNCIAVASTGISNPEKGLIANHAYSIINANSENQMMTLANPHQSEIPLCVTYNEFLRCFRRITVASP